MSAKIVGIVVRLQYAAAFLAGFLAMAAGIPGVASAQLDDEKVKTEVLELPPDPPAVVTADASRLLFETVSSPAGGLLSQQLRTLLRALLKKHRRDRIVHLRAFVAGSGDTRRVQAVVSEVFVDRKRPLPALSVAHVGMLPQESAAVVLEVVAETAKPVNPHGLVFISGESVVTGEPVLDVAPLAGQSLDRVRAVTEALALAPDDVLRVTCYCSSLRDGNAVRQAAHARFPRAAVTYLQVLREYTGAAVTCEAVARLAQPISMGSTAAGAPGLDPHPVYSHAALAGPGRVALTGIQIGFRHQARDMGLAFERMASTLAGEGASMKDVLAVRFYTLSGLVAEQLREAQFQFFDKERPPAGTVIQVQDLPSLDATFAMDAIAIVKR